MSTAATASSGAGRRDDDLEACTRAVEDFLLGLRGAISALASDAVSRLDPDRRPDAADLLAAVEEPAARVLEDWRVLGAGFVADPEALGGEPLLAWWQGERRARVTQPVALGRDADYRTKEWFRAPLRGGSGDSGGSGGLHVTGPYLDYVCSDEFVLTLTLPVEDAQGRVLGLAGADVLAETLEEVLAPALAPARAVLVNRNDQIVVAGDGRCFAGDRVDRGAYGASRACRDLPLTVLASTTRVRGS